MQMTNITIKGCAAFADPVEFQLSAIVAIQGKNRQGKSSLLACIKYPFQNGHDPDMVNGEDGEIVITFDDGSSVRATVDKNKTERMVKTPGATRWAKGRKFIDDISNAISFDPIGFLALKEKEQVETLLQIMPVKVEVEELKTAITGFELEASESVTSSASGLEVINQVRTRIYSDRTRVNVEADTYEKHAAALSQGLKDMTLTEGADWDKEVQRLTSETARLAGEEEKEQGSLRESFVATKAAIDKQFFSECAEVDRDIDAQIADLQERRRVAHEVSRVHCDEKIGELKNDSASKRTDITRKYSEQKTAVATDLAVAQVRAEQKQKSAGQENAMEEAKKEAVKRRTRSGEMTAAIGRLDDLKRKVASRMAIPGIDIVDGRICRDENGKLVPIYKWNEADRIVFVLRLAVLCHGKAGFICLDNLEHLDKDKRVSFMKAAQKYATDSGLQFFIATVGDGPLDVKDALA